MPNPSDPTQPIFVQGDQQPRARWVPPAMTAYQLEQPEKPKAVAHWVITFDETWRTNTHRTALPAARRCRPDGFVLLRCYAETDAEAVRSIVATLFGGEFKDVVPFDHYAHDSRRSFPHGCLATYDASERVWKGIM